MQTAARAAALTAILPVAGRPVSLACLLVASVFAQRCVDPWIVAGQVTWSAGADRTWLAGPALLASPAVVARAVSIAAGVQV